MPLTPYRLGSVVLASLASFLIAAAAPGQGLDTPTLLLMTTAIVGIILLRGVFLRRHLRRKRRGSDAKAREGAETATESEAQSSSDGDGDGGD